MKRLLIFGAIFVAIFASDLLAQVKLILYRRGGEYIKLIYLSEDVIG